ncbi:MAG: hypothetical protein QM739_01180 [Propionivibrio sp.]
MTLMTASTPGIRRQTCDGKTPSGKIPIRTMSKCADGKSRKPPLLQRWRTLTGMLRARQRG